MKISRGRTRKNPPYQWKAGWGVLLEWQGDKFHTLPLLEIIVHRNSNSSGTWMDGTGLCDASWNFDDEKSARCVFENLRQTIRQTRMVWGGFVNLVLLHDWAPDKRMKRLAAFRRGKTPQSPCVRPLRRRKKGGMA